MGKIADAMCKEADRINALHLDYKWAGTDDSGYDCSGYVSKCLRAAGFNIAANTNGLAQGSGCALLKNGFEDVTDRVTLSSGAGMKRGDIIVRYVPEGSAEGKAGHTEFVYTATASGATVLTGSRGSSGACTTAYYDLSVRGSHVGDITVVFRHPTEDSIGVVSWESGTIMTTNDLGTLGSPLSGVSKWTADSVFSGVK